MKLRRVLAVRAAKLVGNISRKMGRQGVTWAGLVARLIYPDILQDLAGQLRGKSFIVCGTNGKTTTNNLLCSAIEAEGKKIICNRTGSNMQNGVVAAFVLAADKKGNIDADYACIEIDEASTMKVLPRFKPDFMVLTNLFRDQLDRYGEIDITMDILKKAIKMAPDMTLLINGDDSLSVTLALDTGNKYHTYGISEKVLDGDENSEIREGRFCKKCGAKMKYHFYHYSQLGDYECPGCGFKRPAIEFDASHIFAGDHLSFEVEGRKNRG